MRMVKKLLLGLLLLLCAGVSRAQSQSVSVNYGVQVGPAHYAQLSFVTSVTAGVTTYNIYRSETSGSGYIKVGSIASTGQQFQSYQDQGLPAGKTYYYVVTAVGPLGESSNSNQGSGTVPTP